MHAVDDVSFAVREGETLGLVGESGCGKSTLGRTIVRLLEPTAGEILFEGQRDRGARRRASCGRCGGEMQMVFQDPYASPEPAQAGRLDHRRPAEDPRARRQEASGRRRSRQLLETVGLSPEHYNRFPHEFSGGQRQRIGIARALALRPKLDRRRRAGVGARRLDPVADAEPARGSPERVQPDLHLHRPRPRRRAARERPDRGHVPRQARRALAGGGALPAADHAVHRGAPLGGADPGSRSGGEARSGSCSRGTCRARSTRRAAAASIPAAGTRPRSARRSSRRSSTTGTGTWRPATTR